MTTDDLEMTAPTEGIRPQRTLLRYAPLVLFIFVVALYAPSMHNGFMYDDHDVILDQAGPSSAAQVMRLFFEPHFGTQVLPYYRPLPLATYLIQKGLHGDRPGPFHLFNAILMAAAAALAYALLRLPSFGVRPGPALLASAVFALHPAASSCVYAITSRETLLAGVLVLGAVYAFLRGGTKWQVVALAAFAGALLSKEQAVTVPLLFVLADVLGLSANPPGRSVRRWLYRYGPVGAVLLLYLVIRWSLFEGAEYEIAVLHAPAGPLLSLGYALQTIITPFKELVYEPTGEIWPQALRLVIVAVVLLVLGTCSLKFWSSIRLAGLFWLGWFAVTLLPTVNLLEQEAHFAERYVWLAVLGFTSITAAIASAAWDKSPARHCMTGLGIVLVLGCAAISLNRASYFKDDFAFFEQWLRTNPRSSEAHNGLGAALARADKIDEAARHYSEAIRNDSNHAQAHNNLGILLADAGETEAAIAHFNEAVRIRRDYAAAYNNLGIALARTGKIAEAIRCHFKALEINPDDAAAHNNLGMALARQGKIEQAIREYSKAITLSPDSAEPHYNLGNALAAQGDIQRAIEECGEALRLALAASQIELVKQIRKSLELYETGRPFPAGRGAESSYNGTYGIK